MCKEKFKEDLFLELFSINCFYFSEKLITRAFQKNFPLCLILIRCRDKG